MSDFKIKKVYSDAELLGILKKTADQLGHSPSQKEIPQDLRLLIKQRFGKWPYALQKAGLAKSAGRDGVSVKKMEEERKQFEMAMLQIRQMKEELERLPEMEELGEWIPFLKTRFVTWAEVLKASGVDQNWTQSEAVEKIAPYSSVYLKDYGRTKKKNRGEELFKVTDLDEYTRHQLSLVYRTAKRLGRAPLKNEINAGLHGDLLQKFGSWRNILYQINLEPLSRNEAAEIRRKQREQRKRDMKKNQK